MPGEKRARRALGVYHRLHLLVRKPVLFTALLPRVIAYASYAFPAMTMCLPR